MKPLFILLFLSFAALTASSQKSDMLVLKKRDQTIETWFPGSIIDFQFSSMQWIEGIIKIVRNDSIIMEQIELQRVANQFGFPTIDTVKLGYMKLHISEIYAMPKRNEGSGIISNGNLFRLGGGAYIFLNIFNSLIHGDPVFGSQNLPGLGIAAGAVALGTLLHLTHETYIVLGKKYKMETIRLGNMDNKISSPPASTPKGL